MGFEPLSVTVDGKAVRLFRGATVRHALINAAASSELVKQVASGGAVVWDETAGAQTDLGGALYDGQVLAVKLSR
ncbi:MAG: hypothetical protein JWN15_3690 [Firmicutes bacterium]|nr:hypothetical protein [Bacillota bacterium]